MHILMCNIDPSSRQECSAPERRTTASNPGLHLNRRPCPRHAADRRTRCGRSFHPCQVVNSQSRSARDTSWPSSVMGVLLGDHLTPGRAYICSPPLSGSLSP